jgi:hypothetical protein
MTDPTNASALPDEPSADVWAEYEGLVLEYAVANEGYGSGRGADEVRVRAARSALDTFMRRCIGVGRAPRRVWNDGVCPECSSGYTRARLAPNDDLWRAHCETCGNRWTWTDRAPVTPDDTQKLREVLGSLLAEQHLYGTTIDQQRVSVRVDMSWYERLRSLAGAGPP